MSRRQRISILIKKRSTWLLLWVFGTYLLCSGNWGGRDFPASDPAYYYQQVFQTLDNGVIPFRGYIGEMELGHPGPILYWILTVGAFLGKAFGVSVISGGIVAYSSVCAALILASGAFIKRATNSVLVPVGTITVLWWMLGSHPDYWEGLSSGGLHVWPIYGPALGGFFLMAGLSAAASAINGDKVAAFWAIVFAGLAMQSNASFIPESLILFIEGVWILSRNHKWRLLISSVVLGYGAIFARLYVDGVDFPIKYAQQVWSSGRDLKSNWQDYSLDYLLSIAWGTQGRGVLFQAVVAFSILLGIGFLYFKNRRVSVFLALSYLYSLLVVSTVVMKTHHVNIISPFLAIGIGGGIGVLFEFLIKKLPARSQVYGTVSVVLSALLWVQIAGFREYGSYNMPEMAIVADVSDKRERLDSLEQAITDIGVSKGDTVGFLSPKTKDERYVWFLRSIMSDEISYELLSSFSVSGALVCISGSPPTRDPAAPPDCSGKNVDIWVSVAASDLKMDIPPVGIFKIKMDQQTTVINLYTSTSPQKLGFIWCETPGEVPLGIWWYGSTCDQV